MVFLLPKNESYRIISFVCNTSNKTENINVVKFLKFSLKNGVSASYIL